jgi:hypothetical protein
LIVAPVVPVREASCASEIDRSRRYVSMSMALDLHRV